MNVDDETKKQMLKAGAPAIAKMMVPLMQVGITNHFENKRIAKQQDFEVRMAEHRSGALQAAAGAEGQRPEPQPAPFEREEEAYEGDDPLNDAVEVAEDLDRTLTEARETEECEFCRDVLGELEDEPPEVQRQGLRELRELKQVMYSDPSRDEMDQVMERLEIVPRMVV